MARARKSVAVAPMASGYDKSAPKATKVKPMAAKPAAKPATKVKQRVVR